MKPDLSVVIDAARDTLKRFPYSAEFQSFVKDLEFRSKERDEQQDRIDKEFHKENPYG